MATILNNDPGGTRDSSAGWIVAVVVLILAVLFGIFVLPGLMNSEADTAESEAGVRGDLGTDRSGDGSAFEMTVTNSTTTVTTDDDTRATTTTR